MTLVAIPHFQLTRNCETKLQHSFVHEGVTHFNLSVANETADMDGLLLHQLLSVELHGAMVPRNMSRLSAGLVLVGQETAQLFFSKPKLNWLLSFKVKILGWPGAESVE